MPETNSDPVAEKANQLYWRTERPAGELAKELEISRSKLYSLIQPFRIERPCEVCGGPLAFSTRTDREGGRARCLDCDASADVPSSAAPPDDTGPAAEEGPPLEPTAEEAFGDRGAPESLDIWLSAVAGAAVGFIAAAWWRRR